MTGLSRQPVAIKVLVPRTASDSTAWELFERSTQVLQGLRHPGLPAVLAFERAEPARLGPLRNKVVFVGGAATGLLIADPAAPTPRPTQDVDVIVEVASRAEYNTALRDQLLDLGFTEDIDEVRRSAGGSWPA
ncbi:MAG TPA: hypothetical protein VGQ83_32115 [Polyangia bacterium]